MSASSIQDSVKEYYGRTLQGSDDLLCDQASGCGVKPPAVVMRALSKVPDEVLAKYYGCGNPLPDGIDGCSVLDLGCGTGRDCYVAALVAGEKGRVVGVDFSDEQLAVATGAVADFAAKNPTAAPLEFVRGDIEDLASCGVAPNSVDVAISNCVVNLCPNKRAVLQGVYEALKPGGEFHFSDMYCDRRQPPAVKTDKLLWGEGFAGSQFLNDFVELCKDIGFVDPRQLGIRAMGVKNAKVLAAIGDAKYYSITYRLFKLPAAAVDAPTEGDNTLERTRECYGHTATYKGTIPTAPESYQFDLDLTLPKGEAVNVCGNTAAMLRGSWLAAHFDVVGDKTVHNCPFVHTTHTQRLLGPCQVATCNAGA